jgi:hypothetical protein
LIATRLSSTSTADVHHPAGSDRGRDAVEQRLESLTHANYLFGRAAPVDTLPSNPPQSLPSGVAERDVFLQELEQRRRIGTTRSLPKE